MGTAIVTPVPAIPVNPAVLKWAREERGYDLASAAKLLRIPEAELAGYEQGTKAPMLGLLRNMSAKYEINQVSLFLPSPPVQAPKIPDYRSRLAGHVRDLGHETIIAIQEVRDALESFAEVRDIDPGAIPLPSLDKVLKDETPDALAKRQRKKFGLTIDAWKKLGTPYQARHYWRDLIESNGVFVYFLKMAPEDCRGFSIMHEGLAAICVNDRETIPGAKSFTMWHEYCHLLRRQTGISDENRTNALERYCNQFAASFLIPLIPLREALNSPSKPAEYSSLDVKRLANRFRVSQRAMALRLEQTGLAPEGYYNRQTASWDLPRERKDVGKQQIFRTLSVVDVAERSFGRKHTTTVLRALKRGSLEPGEARGLLRVPMSKFPELQARFE